MIRFLSMRSSRPGRRRLALAALPPALLLTILAAPQGHAANAFIQGGSMPGLGSGRIWHIAIDPAQPAQMLAATDNGLYTSTTSGASWTLTLPGVRVWTAGFDVRTPADAFAGTATQGVEASTDAGQTWSPAATGLPSQNVRALAFGLDGIAAGTDRGVAESPDGHHWHSAGLTQYSISSVAVAANSPQFTVIAGADSGNIPNAALFVSSGSNWQPLQAGLPAAAVVSSVTAGPIDAAVPKRPLVVATSKGVYRSGDGGVTWTSSNGIPDQSTITTVLFDPLDPSVVYAGADAAGSTGGTFLRSTDGGQTFATATAGLPSSKNVESIAIAQTNPLTVAVAIDPPSGAASVYTEADTTLPTRPQLVAEATGAPVPTVVATPTPAPTPSRAAVAPATPTASPNGFGQFAGTAFHFPTPLLYEVLFVLLIVYVVIRWRQRYYIEGPP